MASQNSSDLQVLDTATMPTVVPVQPGPNTNPLVSSNSTDSLDLSRQLEQKSIQLGQQTRSSIQTATSQVTSTAQEIQQNWPKIEQSVKDASQVTVESMEQAKKALESSGQGNFVLDMLKGMASQFGLTDAATGVGKLFGGSIKVYEGILTGNFKKVQEGMSEYGSGLLNLAKGGLNFVGEMVGAKDIMRGFEALQKGDLLGAALGFGFGIAQAAMTVSTFGLGSAAFSMFARTVGKQWLQTGAKEAFQVFAKETAKEVGEYMTKNISKEVIEKTFTEAGKEVAEKVAKEGIEKVTAESIKDISKDATKRATEELLSKAKVDEVITKLVEQRLDAISQNVSRKFTAKSKELFEVVEGAIADKKLAKQVTDKLQKALKSGKNVEEELEELAKFMKGKGVSDDVAGKITGQYKEVAQIQSRTLSQELKALGVPEEKILQYTMGSRTQFLRAGQQGVYGAEFDKVIKEIFTQEISKEVKENLLKGGAREAFEKSLTKELEELAAKSGKITPEKLKELKEAAMKGFDEGLDEAVTQFVSKAVDKGFERFRNRHFRSLDLDFQSKKFIPVITIKPGIDAKLADIEGPIMAKPEDLWKLNDKQRGLLDIIKEDREKAQKAAKEQNLTDAEAKELKHRLEGNIALYVKEEKQKTSTEGAKAN